MLREPDPLSWGGWPPDHEPVHRAPHPIRRGLAAAWVILGLFLASPLLIAALVGYAWWEVFRWLIRK